ncbi:hypothetical protein, partial [Pseudomonas sp. NBRC 111138]|uniref:hypothetical protein n=1 Tax=Pseudomonas sp. NBRC 111138 TaxID=1661053 RepID=UPI001C46988D
LPLGREAAPLFDLGLLRSPAGASSLATGYSPYKKTASAVFLCLLHCTHAPALSKVQALPMERAG